jgi:hypothetical protein
MFVEELKKYWITIPVQTVCYTGWEKNIQGRVYSLDHVNNEIVFSINNIIRHKFSCHERIIPYTNALRNGGYWNEERSFVYYVVDGTKRFKFIYLQVKDGKFQIGTRKSLGAKYQLTTLLHKQ